MSFHYNPLYGDINVQVEIHCDEADMVLLILELTHRMTKYDASTMKVSVITNNYQFLGFGIL